jgi:hypothetical protein
MIPDRLSEYTTQLNNAKYSQLGSHLVPMISIMLLFSTILFR